MNSVKKFPEFFQMKEMRISSEEFCETGKLQIKLKKKMVRMSYETGQVQTCSVYIRRSIRNAVLEPNRPERRSRISPETFKVNSQSTQGERRLQYLIPYS